MFRSTKEHSKHAIAGVNFQKSRHCRNKQFKLKSETGSLEAITSNPTIFFKLGTTLSTVKQINKLIILIKV